MRAFFALAPALLLLLAVPAVGAPPPVVGDVEWIHVPGVSSTGTFTVQWGTAQGLPDAYELEEDTSPFFTAPFLVFQGNAQSCTLMNRPNGIYWYRVRAVHTMSLGVGPWLACDHAHAVDGSLASVPSLPAAPASVTVPSFSNGPIPISWTVVAGATAFDIQESHVFAPPAPSPNLSTPWVIVAAGVTSNPTSFAGSNGLVYRFRVRTQQAVGAYTLYSLWSYASLGCTVNAALPGAVASLTVPATSSSGSIALQWTAAANGAAYEVEEDISPAFLLPVQVWTGTGTSCILAGRASATYSYRVRAVNATGPGPFTAGANPCAVNLLPVGVPSSVAVPSTSSTGSYTVSWAAADNASTYELEEDANAAFASPVAVYQGAATSHSVSGRPDGTYTYRVRGVNALGAGAYAAGGGPCTVSLSGTLSVSAGSAPASAVPPGTPSVPVLPLLLAVDVVETITVTSLVVTESGSAGLAGSVDAARLLRDVNADGREDAGDVVLATVPFPAGPVLAFTGLFETLAPSSSVSWLVVYDVAPAAPFGGTLEARIAQDADVAAAGSISPAPAVAGCPVTGGAFTIAVTGSLAASAGAANPPDADAAADAKGLCVLHFVLAASQGEGVLVESLTFHATGTVDDVAAVSAIRVYRDDGDGAFDPGADAALAGAASFDSDEGAAFLPLSEVLPAGSARGFFVVCDFDAPTGGTFRASLATAGDVAARGSVTGNAASVSGMPVFGGQFTLLAPPPEPAGKDGRCGGTPDGGPAALLGWLGLLAAFLLVRRAAGRHAVPFRGMPPAPCGGGRRG